MNRDDMLANPPHNAQKPLTFLESRDGDLPELTVISALGTRWQSFGFDDGWWSPWSLRGGDWSPKDFHDDNWQEVTR